MCGCGRINRVFASASLRQATPALVLGRGLPTDFQMSSRVKGDTESLSSEEARKNKPASLPYCAPPPHAHRAKYGNPQVCLLLTLLCTDGEKPLTEELSFPGGRKLSPWLIQPVFLRSHRSLGTVLFCQSCGLVDYNSLQLLEKIAQRLN